MCLSGFLIIRISKRNDQRISIKFDRVIYSSKGKAKFDTQQNWEKVKVAEAEKWLNIVIKITKNVMNRLE